MEMICDKCGKVIPEPEWKTIRDGDIEHTYFTCAGCGEPFRVSTTDGKLRRDIAKYTEMAQHLKRGKCTEQFHRKVQKLKESNVKRGREIADAHPLALLLMKE